MKNRNIKYTVISILGILLFIYIINFFNNAENKLSGNQVKLEKDIPADYLYLFKSQKQKDIVLQSATSFKLRNAIVDIVYKDKYDIMLTKVTIQSGFHLGKDIIEINKKSKGIFPETNSSYIDNDFRITYNGNSTDTISKIFLTLNGDSAYTFNRNDSIAYYYSNLKSGYLQYKHEGVYEISIESKKEFYFFDKKNPIIIMFLKRNNLLYIITLSGRNENILVNPDIIHEIFS